MPTPAAGPPSIPQDAQDAAGPVWPGTAEELAIVEAYAARWAFQCPASEFDWSKSIEVRGLLAAMYAKEADIVDVRFETDAQDISWLNDPGTISPATAHWGVWPLQYYSTEPGYGPPGCAGSYWMAMYTGVLADDPFNDECPEDDPHCVRGPTWAWAWGQEE